jgi:hypothetical protein
MFADALSLIQPPYLVSGGRLNQIRQEAEGEAGRRAAVKLFIGSMASHGPRLRGLNRPT